MAYKIYVHPGVQSHSNMKCIKDLITGAILRVKNAIAETHVLAGTHTYCKKTEWKAQIRPHTQE